MGRRIVAGAVSNDAELEEPFSRVRFVRLNENRRPNDLNERRMAGVESFIFNVSRSIFDKVFDEMRRNDKKAHEHGATDRMEIPPIFT